LKYYEDGVSKRIIAYDKPFTEAEAHFADAKFYFKKYAIKVDEITSGDSELLNKKAKVVFSKTKFASKEDLNFGNPKKTRNINSASSSKNVNPLFFMVQRNLLFCLK